MRDSAYSWEQQRTRAIIDQVFAKADLTPSLTAVRHSGQAATYGALAEALTRYEQVASKHSINAEAALPASVLHCLPNVGKLGSPDAVAGALGEILSWLGRDVPRGDEGRGHLRAVG
ncbi:hypothetical protein [Gordonia sp. NPDC003422]